MRVLAPGRRKCPVRLLLNMIYADVFAAHWSCGTHFKGWEFKTILTGVVVVSPGPPRWSGRFLCMTWARDCACEDCDKTYEVSYSVCGFCSDWSQLSVFAVLFVLEVDVLSLADSAALWRQPEALKMQDSCTRLLHRARYLSLLWCNDLFSWLTSDF